MERALAELRAQLQSWDARCAARGERVAKLEEHDRALNGTLEAIRAELTTIRESVQQAREAIALAKGVWIIASMLLGAAIAWAAQFLPA